jgi:hypothetical protein
MNAVPASSHRSRDLISDLAQGRAVVFAGAGISLGTHGQRGLPSAADLTRELALESDFCQAGRCWNYDSNRRRCNWDSGCVNSYPEVAEHYGEQLGRPALVAFLRDRIDLPGLKPLRTHRAIARLPVSMIVTTNWDGLMEESLREEGKRVATIVDNYEVAFSDYGDVLLVKMHGSIDRPQSIIATERDYDEFFERLPNLVDMLLYFFATRTFLFVGYSLADPNFKRMYLQVTRHLQDRYGHLFRRTAYADQWHSSEYQRRFWLHHNLRIIDEDATVFLETLVGLASDLKLGKATGNQRP